MRPSIATIALFTTLTACSGTQRAATHAPTSTPRDSRLRFNQLALRLNLPLFWAQDTNGNGAPDPDEVRSLWFYPDATQWVRDGQFTPAYEQALAQIRAEDASPTPTDPRERLVRAELDHAAPTLVETDLSALPASQRAFAQAMLVVAARIDELYALETGSAALAERVRGLDAASRSLFRRNWGPRCRGSQTEREPLCSAIPGQPRPVVGVYPAGMQTDDGSAPRWKHAPMRVRFSRRSPSCAKRAGCCTRSRSRRRGPSRCAPSRRPCAPPRMR
jgi:hypothetical protein